MENGTADRNLLFGVLALQMDFITREALLAAMQAWAFDKGRSLGDILLGQGAMTADSAALLEALVRKHLALHGDDAGQSLAAVGVAAPVAAELNRIADPAVHATLATLGLPTAAGADAQATRPASEVAPTGGGGRFRTLRPHARGGLGEVFVALDQELHREVALKEIQPRHADDPDSRGRFVLEAEVTGGLEHPGVVPVYGLGTYADGRPYYAMRFIKGDSLQQAIEHFHAGGGAGRDPGQRVLALRQLLGRFLAVCNTVAYAHSRGVIHRDLKPANIMLGPYGETLVVDWGLAKATGRHDETTSPGERTLIPTATGSSSATQMGSVIGTPAFMPPEQAAGEIDRLGPAADVYSLGATLYALLTGHAPFQDRDVTTMLERVRTGDFRPPRTVSRDVPAPLEAVCLKAMAREPGRRYAGALELAADVEHWLADEPVSAWREPWRLRARRWVKRHRALVTAAAAAALVAVVSLAVATVLLGAANERERSAREVAVQREQEAREQRDKAEHNFKLARDAVDRFHTKVSENRLLNEPGFQPLRKELLETAREFYERFVRERAGDPAVRADQARALARLGAITNDLGSVPRAVELYKEALAVWQKLADEHPDVPEYRSGLAGCSYTLGELYEAVGRNPDALAAYRKAVDVGEELCRKRPGVAEYQRDLAKHLGLLGRMHVYADQRDQAEAVLRRALEIGERCARDNPGSADCQFCFIGCRIRLAFLHGAGLQHAKAVALFEPARTELEALVRREPRARKYQETLAQNLEGFGSVYFLGGRPDKAEESIRAGLAVREKLAREDPRNLEYQEKLAGAHNALIKFFAAAAVLSGKREGADKAEEAYRRAVPALEKLTRENPAVTKYRQQLAQAHHEMATLYEHLKQTAKAAAAEQQAADIREKLASEHPEVVDFQEELSESALLLGNFYSATNQTARAEGAWRKVVRALERLTSNPGASANAFRSRGFHAQRAGAYFKLGSLYLNSGRKDQAEAEFGKAVELRERLAREMPKDVSAKKILAYALSAAARAYDANGHSDRAAAAVGRALEIWEALGREDRDSSAYRTEAADCLSQLGDLHAKAGWRGPAETAYKKSIAIHEKLPARERAKGPRQFTLAATYGGLAAVYRGAGLLWEAVAAQTRAIAVREGLARSEPNNLVYQQQVGFAWNALGSIHHTADHRREAEAAFKNNLAIWEKLVPKQPNNVLFQIILGDVCNHLGWVALRDDRSQDALDWFARSARTLQPLLDKGAQHTFLRPTLSNAHWGRANALLRLARLAESIKDWDLALKYDQGASRDVLRLGRACATALQGQHAEATAMAKEVAEKAPQNGNVLYNAVYVYCLSSQAANRDQTLAAADRDKLAGRYTAEAFTLLARAKAAGAFSTPVRVGSLKTDKLLDPLRSGEPFKKFLAGAEAQSRLRRGDAYANLGQWDRARADFARALENEPDNADASFRLALLHLRAGDVAGYRALCAGLLRRFAGTKDNNNANTVAWTCTLAPGAVADFSPVVRLAEQAAAARPETYEIVSTLGCVRYRQGTVPQRRAADLVRAQRLLDRACQLEGKGGGGLEWLFLSMTHQQQGHADDARRWFDKATAWMAAHDKPGKGKPPLPWTRRLELDLLRREAQQLLGPSKP